MDFQVLNVLIKCGKEFGHKKIRGFGLSDTEFLICSFVQSHEGCSQDDVVRGLRLDKTTTAKAMAALEGKGFMHRGIDQKDHRKKVLKVTKEGVDRCATIIGLHNKWMESVMQVLSKEEREQFESYCCRLLKAAEEKTRNED